MYSHFCSLWFQFAWNIFFHPFIFNMILWWLQGCWFSQILCFARLLVFQSTTEVRGFLSGADQGKFRWLSHGGSDSGKSAFNAGNQNLLPGLGRYPGERNSNPFQSSCLENSMDRQTRQTIVHGVTKTRTRLSGQHTHIQRWGDRKETKASLG